MEFESDLQTLDEVLESDDSMDDKFDTEKIEDARTKLCAQIVQRRGQPEFRAKLLEAYNHKCAVTGFDCDESLEAAHIVPYMGEYTDHLTNGLLLRGDLHSLFDLGFWSVETENMSVVISEDLRGTEYEYLAGNKLNLPDSPEKYPSKDALDWHRRRFDLDLI